MEKIFSLPPDDRIVIFGMSCSGKTTFAQSFDDREYYCFDALFQWHLIETLGLSIKSNLRYVREHCDSQKFILDGWHLSDKEGNYLPDNSAVYVIWAPYDRIISQYRIPVMHYDEFRDMYHKWYCQVNYSAFPRVRYFENQGNFLEISAEKFISQAHSQ